MIMHFQLIYNKIKLKVFFSLFRFSVCGLFKRFHFVQIFQKVQRNIFQFFWVHQILSILYFLKNFSSQTLLSQLVSEANFLLLKFLLFLKFQELNGNFASLFTFEGERERDVSVQGSLAKDYNNVSRQHNR